MTSDKKIIETELDRQKAIMNKFMPVSYYEHHKLFLDTDVLKMMDMYRQSFTKPVSIEISSHEQDYPEATC
jgi:galactose-1-phosphate uridylyltransferase